ncbi:MAG: hypothetical protein LQ340_008130, partial [Diploschistes diacapsis]
VDFAAVDLPTYSEHYALILDNAFTASECQQLSALALASASNTWERALVNTGGNTQALIEDIRNCSRIIWDSRDLVARIWARIQPFVHADIGLVVNSPLITGYGPVRRNEAAIFSRLNERMRFLKYGPGEYFREHCDGQYRTPEGDEFSLFTLHLYMNERDEGSGNLLEGGATRFFGPDYYGGDWGDEPKGKYFDVEPKMGRVVVFQQRGLLHSGEEVVGGEKWTMRTDVMYRKSKEEEGGV